MELVKVNDIYDFISLFPLVLYTYGFVMIFMEKDIFILLGMILSHEIQGLVKRNTKTWNPKIFKRPDNARDTNAFNLGGFTGNNPGFPSGHTFAVSYVMYYLILKNNDDFYSLNSIFKQLTILIVAYARVLKGAHRIIQVIAGYFFGLALAYGMVYISNLFFLKFTNTLPNL